MASYAEHSPEGAIPEPEAEVPSGPAALDDDNRTAGQDEQQQEGEDQQFFETLAPPSPTHQQQVAEAAVAHHGLQALQAASAAPVVTSAPSAADVIAQQYAQSAAMQMGDFDTPDHHHDHHDDHHASAMQQGLSTGPDGSLGPPGASQKVTRLRRACDMCSQRKVKCDESGPPCKPCMDLQVECTFNRQMKRRGPPNKHAEAARAAKRAREEISSDTSFTPHIHTNGVEALVSLEDDHSHQTTNSVPVDSTPFTLDAESIAPWPILELLVDDFYTYIHPLTPFPHEPSFRQAFVNRADRHSREFLALLASMIGALVASFPRSARAHLKATHSVDLFPTSLTMIDQCRKIALQARGSFFMDSDEMSIDAVATSYFLAIAASQTMQYKRSKRFLAETISFCREIGANKLRDGPSSAMVDGSSHQIDHIKDQMSKRIFFVLIAGVRSLGQLGTSVNEMPLPPPTAQEPYPEQPLEVDDEYIFKDHILPQPASVVPLIAGFNRNIRVYTTMNELVGVDMCYGINFFDWTAQRNILSNALAAAKQATEDLPPELEIKMEGSGQSDQVSSFDYAGLQYYPPAFPNPQPADDLRLAFAEQPMRRRQLQFEIQKANIYASQLATRSYFVERYLTLRDAHQSTASLGGEDVKDDRDNMVAEERELIVRNLMTYLGSINQRNMEPNGGPLVFKIRSVASTLLNDASDRKGPMALKADQYLSQIVNILIKLERTGATNGTMTPRDEDQELQHWASLRDYQIQFAASGGFIAG